MPAETKSSHNRANGKAPDTPAARIQLAIALHQQGKLAQARQAYEAVLTAQPNNFDALHLLGVVELQTQNTAKGARLIEKAIAINPKIAGAHSNLGHAFKDLGRLEDALASYAKALALEPDLADVYNGRATALKDLGRFDEALADYDKAIALRPISPRLTTTAAMCSTRCIGPMRRSSPTRRRWRTIRAWPKPGTAAATSWPSARPTKRHLPPTTSRWR